MAILLYCIAEAARSPSTVPAGVRGVPLSRQEYFGLTIFSAEAPSADLWMQAPLRDRALEFHRVLEAVFSSTAIIPFRFPTIVRGTGEVGAHMEERASLYATLLERFRTSVQLEALVSYSSGQHRLSRPVGGKEYLRERQEIMASTRRWAENLRAAVAALAREWRSRAVDRGIRSFALVERERVAEFNERAGSVSPPQNIRMRVSGPWPVTEFLDLNCN